MNDDLFKDKDPRFINIRGKIFIFILSAIILLGIISIGIGINKKYFISKVSIFFVSDTGLGIETGMAVNLSGFRIGKVKSVALNDVAAVDVELSIETQYLKWIKLDSSASIKKAGYIGDAYVEITPGTSNLSALKSGDYIKYVKAGDFAEIAIDLKNSIIPVLTEVKLMLSYLNDPKGNFRNTVHNTQVITSQLPKMQNRIDQTLLMTNQTLGKLGPAIDASQSGLVQAELLLKESLNLVKIVKDEAPSTLLALNKVLNESHDVLEEGNILLKESKPQIGPILLKTRETLDSTDKTLKSAQNLIEVLRPDFLRLLGNGNLFLEKGTTVLSGADSLINEGGNVVDETQVLIEGVKHTWPFSVVSPEREKPELKLEAIR